MSGIARRERDQPCACIERFANRDERSSPITLRAHKKRRVEEWTRLPTKRMATACWAFIVAKATSAKAAPMLVFSSLQGTNKENYQQVIHKAVWMAWGHFNRFKLRARHALNLFEPPQIICAVSGNPSFVTAK
jgi:hypothetical protein